MDILIILAGILPAIAFAVGVCAYEMDATNKRMNKIVAHMLGKDTCDEA